MPSTAPTSFLKRNAACVCPPYLPQVTRLSEEFPLLENPTCLGLADCCPLWSDDKNCQEWGQQGEDQLTALPVFPHASVSTSVNPCISMREISVPPLPDEEDMGRQTSLCTLTKSYDQVHLIINDRLLNTPMDTYGYLHSSLQRAPGFIFSQIHLQNCF